MPNPPSLYKSYSLSHLINLVHNGSYRKSQRQVVLFGRTALLDVIKIKKPLQIHQTLSAYPTSPLISSPAYSSILPDHVQISSSTAQRIAGTSSRTTDVLTVVQYPEWMDKLPMKGCDFHRILIVNGISDPGNLGTLIRTAAALQWDYVVVVGGGVDPLHVKALRASKGATLMIPWIMVKSWSDIDIRGLLRNADGGSIYVANALVAADANTETEPHHPFDPQRIVLVLSNESHGLQSHPVPIRSLRQLGFRLYSIGIPMAVGCGSLNVAIAGGVLMFSLHNRVGLVTKTTH